MAVRFWTRLPLFILVLAFLAPIISLVVEAGNSFWRESIPLRAARLVDYSVNSVLLVTGSLLGATIFGLSSAWLCARREFTGRWVLLWGSILPLAVPGYLAAYSWVDFLIDAGFPGGQLRNLPFACLIFSVCLSPYVFLPAYAALVQLPGSLLESARLLGLNGLRLFLAVELPLIRSSLVAGVLMAGLEVLADFGTVDFMAVDTWTTAIYRTWFGLGDRGTASLLAVVLFAVSALVLFRDSRSRSKRSLAGSTRKTAPLRRSKRSLLSILPILLPAATPGVLGCLMPVSILSTRVLRNWSSLEIWTTIHEPILTTLFVAAAAGLTVVSIALVLVWTIRTESNPAIRFFARVSSLGYALPGGVLGLGLLIFLAPLYLTGTLVGLLYGYSVRFATIGTSSIEARWQSIPTLYESQARLLGCSAAGAFFRVTLPLLQRSILCAFVLTTIDVIKELPATMLLRPFNVETLAIRTYNLASDERLAETAPSSLAMVLLCAAGVFAAQKLGAFSVGEDGNRGEKNDRKTSLT